MRKGRFPPLQVRIKVVRPPGSSFEAVFQLLSFALRRVFRKGAKKMRKGRFPPVGFVLKEFGFLGPVLRPFFNLFPGMFLGVFFSGDFSGRFLGCFLGAFFPNS